MQFRDPVLPVDSGSNFKLFFLLLLLSLYTDLLLLYDKVKMAKHKYEA